MGVLKGESRPYRENPISELANMNLGKLIQHYSEDANCRELLETFHTNGVEGLRILLQRTLIGAYHKVNVKHLKRYLDELVCRFSNRENKHIFRDTLERMPGHRPLTFEILTG